MRFIESQEQIKVIQWASLNSQRYAPLKWLHSSLNGVRVDSSIKAKRLKDEGMKGGVFDLFLPYPNSKFAGLYIEMKRPKVGKSPAGKLSAKQKEFYEYGKNVGYNMVVAYTANEAIEAILNHLKDSKC